MKATNSFSDPSIDRQNSRGSSTATPDMMTSMEEQAAAILPLGESLPLQRRAVRLAVPPLRWRRRPPPELRQAQLRVMSLDLSWRRASASGGSAAATASKRKSSSNPAASIPQWGVEVGMEEEEGEEEEEEEVEQEDEGGGLEQHVAGKVGKAQGAAKVAPGTSLEQAVLVTMLAELGPGWDGLHSENRRGFLRGSRV
ncbi:unnamed protein product [Hapterophycus canaliculatus]